MPKRNKNYEAKARPFVNVAIRREVYQVLRGMVDDAEAKEAPRSGARITYTEIIARLLEKAGHPLGGKKRKAAG